MVAGPPNNGFDQPGAPPFRSAQGRRKERRKRQRERAELYRLNDWELMDIGMTRGEIEYVVSNRSFDREEAGPPVR